MPITYFGYASNQADNTLFVGTQPIAVVPPPNMVAGMLVRVVVNGRFNTIVQVATGGQTWQSTAEAPTAGSGNHREFWCRFNGTWTGNPSWQGSATTYGVAIEMLVFRPSVDSNTWVEDFVPYNGNFATPAAVPYNVNATPSTRVTTANNVLVIVSWLTCDVNTWALVAGSVYANPTGHPQLRIAGTTSRGSTTSTAWRIQPTAGAPTNAANEQTGAGPDSGDFIFAGFREVTAAGPAPSFVDQPAITSKTTNSYGNTSKADASCTWHAITVKRGAATPTPAQVVAGVNYGAVTVLAHNSGPLTANVTGNLTVGGALTRPYHDIHHVVTNASGTSVVASQLAALLNAPASRKRLIVTEPAGGWSTESAAYGATPAIVTGDVLDISDTMTAPAGGGGGEPCNVGADTVPFWTPVPPTDKSRRQVTRWFFQASLDAWSDPAPTYLTINNKAPQPQAFPLLLRYDEPLTIDLRQYGPDPEADVVDVVPLGQEPTGVVTTNSQMVWDGLRTNPHGDYTVAYAFTDAIGDANQATATITIPPLTGGAGAGFPDAITLQIVRTGPLTEPATWETAPATTLEGSGDTRTLPYENMLSDELLITASVVHNGATFQDKVTILKVYDGAGTGTDLTAPPPPTNFVVENFLMHLLASWATPTYTVGGGHQATLIYAARVQGLPLPTFANARPVGSSDHTAFSYPCAPGETWAFWAKNMTKAGVLSATPAGGTNGVQGTAALIGGVNLGPLIVEAGHLADGSITAAKLADAAVGATKFAAGIEPVTIITGAIPGTYVGAQLYRTDDNRLYRWNGTTYTGAVAAADISGQLTNAQIADLAAAKLTGQIVTTQITDSAISTAKLAAGAITSAKIAADTIVASNIAAGAITATELAANAVTANALAANSVVAGKIAAAAVNAAQIAAGAVQTDRLLVTGKGAALNDDPACSDISAWITASGVGSVVTISDGVAGTTALRSQSGGPWFVFSRPFPFDPLKVYRVRARVRGIGSNGNLYLAVQLLDSAGANISGDGTYWFYAQSGPPSAGWTEYDGAFGPGTIKPFPSNARSMTCGVLLNYVATTGYMECQDLRIEERIGSALIVDGAITATKLSANSIAVGTAAIQNGAIVNAMLGNASIDSAKIIDGSITNAKIVNLAVDNAKIANLTVGTGKITDDAISGYVTATQGSAIGIPGTRTPILSLSFSTQGGKVQILAKISAGSFPGGGLLTGNYTSWLTVDGVDRDVQISAAIAGRFVGVWTGILAAGAHTARVDMASTLTCDATGGVITVLEFKK